LQALYNKYTFVFIYLNYNLYIRAFRWAVHGAPKAGSFRPNPLGGAKCNAKTNNRNLAAQKNEPRAEKRGPRWGPEEPGAKSQKPRLDHI